MNTDSREKLGEAIQEEKQLKVCARHPKTVWFDGKGCPVCIIEAENQFLLLTRGMEGGKT
jgi:hypothetical protein